MFGRRVGAGVGVLALMLMIGLSGCNEDNTPTEYNSLTQQNFLELCTNRYYESTDGTLKQTGSTIKSDIDALTQDQCQCQYDVFVQQMPINKAAANGSGATNFTDLNSDLKTNPEEAWATVPDSIKTALQKCVSGTSSSSTTSSTAPATTTTAG